MAKIELVSLECPSCGGTMQYEKGDAKATCPYCGKAVIVSEEETAKNDCAADIKSGAATYRKVESTAAGRRAPIWLPLLVVFGCAMFVIFFAARNSFAKKVAADPFENVTIEFSGRNGSGTARMVDLPDAQIKGLRFSIDKQRGLSNGDTVEVAAGEVEGYRWTQSKKSFTVSGLSEPLKTLSGIPESEFGLFYEASMIALEKAWGNATIKNQPVEWSAERHEKYLLAATSGDRKHDNILYDTYKTVVTMPGGEKREFYQAVSYTDVLKKADGSITADYSKANTENWQLGYYLGFDASAAFYGWESLREMELAFEGMQGYELAK